jgi:hypothetical protein
MSNPHIFYGLVNYGTQSGLFSKEMRNKGFDSVSVTLKDKYKRQTDITLDAGKFSFGNKIVEAILLLPVKLSFFFKYDIFHFFFGKSLLPFNLDLPFYKFFGKKVYMEYLGNDCQLYKESVEKYKWTNMSAMFSPSEGFVLDKKIKKRMSWNNKYVAKNIVCSPNYEEFVVNSHILPLAFDLNGSEEFPLPDRSDSFKIMHAPTDRNFKGTSYIITAVKQLKAKGYNIELLLVENLSHKEIQKMYIKCHVFVDQILAGWYGTAAIEAMSFGRVVVAYMNPENLKKTNTDNPIVSANPDTILSVLENLYEMNSSELNILSKSHRDYVESVHCVHKVTSKLLRIYNE